MSKKGMQDFTRYIEAGTETEIDINGDYFHVFESDTDITLQFDEGQRIKRKAGQGGSVFEYEKVTISSEVTQTVRISVGFGTVTDTANGASSGGGGVSGDVNATIKTANAIKQYGDQTVNAGVSIKVLSANNNRKEAVIVSNANNPDFVRLGTSLVDGSTGIPIDAGGSFTINATSEVWIHNTSPNTAATVHVFETELI